MIWQEFIFLAGSIFSLFVLLPTLTDKTANIPLGTSVPSSFIGLVYGGTFFSMGMTFSAVGALLAGTMWSLIAVFRSPRGPLLLDPRSFLTVAIRTFKSVAGGWNRFRYVP